MMVYEEHLLTLGFKNNGYSLSFIEAILPRIVLKDNDNVIDEMIVDEIDLKEIRGAIDEMEKTRRQLISLSKINKGDEVGK